jgi:hypothetical protein
MPSAPDIDGRTLGASLNLAAAVIDSPVTWLLFSMLER